MGELGDWGYFVVLAIAMFLMYLLGYGNGSDNGFKKGYIQDRREEEKAEKEKRHIDAKA